ncbi:hypothetical protein X943_003902 [Babesia divergens]|uniref:Uncharacterized protein n=1 Tax=Babesia divergens TaxID=32595 RepID=A0AAD9GHY1_BABDI|nr:hypothetical protein X943_003902 [Babesia divergens]
MIFLSAELFFASRFRNWERSLVERVYEYVLRRLRRFNKKQSWKLCRWLTRGTYENMKFRKGWKSATFINPPKQVLPSDSKPIQYCDMERLHRQDREFRFKRVLH